MKLSLLPAARWLCGFWPALAFAALGSSYSQGQVNVAFETVGGKEARVQAAANQVPSFGFLPLTVSTENPLPREFEWTLSLTWNSHNWSRRVSSEHTVRIPGQRSSEHWLFVPSAGDGTLSGFDMASLQLELAGSGVQSDRKTVTSNMGTPGQTMVPWAVSSTLAGSVRRAISELNSTSSPPPPPSTPAQRRRPAPANTTAEINTSALTVFDPALPRNDWRAWSPFARVFLRATEYAALDGGTRAALRSWVTLGGWLYLSPEMPGSAVVERLGAGAIVRLSQPLAGKGISLEAGTSWHKGVMNSTLAQPSQHSLSLHSTELGKSLPAAAQAGTWLAFFFVIFALLVGPVNLFVFAPKAQRSRLFWTVPAMSLGAVVLLVAMIFLQDGLGGRGARRALVVLLPGENQAAVFQEQVSRTGFLFRTTFALPDDTVCAQVITKPATTVRDNMAFNRAAGRAGGDFFLNRSRQGQHLRRLTPTRGRIERIGTEANGAPVMQSSIGTTLTNFQYYDAGTRWTAKTVAPGVRVVLEKAPDSLARHVAEEASAHFRQLFEAAVRPETSGTFVAEAGASELAPLATLESIDWSDSKVLITGRAEKAAGPAPEKASL